MTRKTSYKKDASAKNIVGLSSLHWKMYKLLHRLYLRNSLIDKFLLLILLQPYKISAMLLGCYVPYSAKIGDGLVLPHGFYGIFISKQAVIGKNALIFHQVTIGSNKFTSENYGSPCIGDNCFIGAGAKIVGKISIGDNVRVGANAIVVDSIESNKTVVSSKAVIL